MASKEEHDHSHYHGVDSAEKHVSVDEALALFLGRIGETRSEIVKVSGSDGRILFSNVICPGNLPRVARSSRDGYAIKLATDSDILSFTVVGEVKIGTIPKLKIESGEAAKVATGSSVPRGANAVVMREYSQVEDERLVISKTPKPGDNIVSPGEDLKKGQLLFVSGTRLRPQHVALLSMLGIDKVRVFSKPRIAFFSTGDELEDTGFHRNRKDSASRIFDSNRPFLSASISELGGIPIDLGIARDNFKEIRAKMSRGLGFDALLLSAGSSVGDRDYVSKAAESIVGVEMVVHGVAMRPSSPTGLAIFRKKPIIFLPGFPTSAIVSFYIFGRAAILKLSGSSSVELPTIKATIEEDFVGKPGLSHFLRVRIVREDEKYRASVVRPTEAQYSSWLRQANGIAILGKDGKTSLKCGDQVSIFMIGDA